MRLREVLELDADGYLSVKQGKSTIPWKKVKGAYQTVYIPSIRDLYAEYPRMVAEGQTSAEILMKMRVPELWRAKGIGEPVVESPPADLLYHDPKRRLRIERIKVDGSPADPRLFEMIGSAIYKVANPENANTQYDAISIFYTIGVDRIDRPEHLILIVMGNREPEQEAAAEVMVTIEQAAELLIGLYVLPQKDLIQSNEVENYMNYMYLEMDWDKIDPNGDSIEHIALEAGLGIPMNPFTWIALPPQMVLTPEGVPICLPKEFKDHWDFLIDTAQIRESLKMEMGE